jgi:hypothetical protein
MGAQRMDGAEPPSGADDPEMAELRAFAAEVVSAAGGVPRRSGYRPRLEPGQRGLSFAPVTRLSDLAGDLASFVRQRPGRTLGLALVGCAIAAGVIFLVLPRDGALELAAGIPRPPVAALTPAPPPEVTSIPEHLLETSLPAAPVDPAPSEVRPEPPGKHRVPPRVARSSITKRGVAVKAPPAARTPAKLAALDRVAMSDGMRSIQPRVKDCYREYHQKGVVMTSIEVGADGKVKRVKVSGPLARTRSAACVQAAVKAARFSGAGRFQYPLVLK